jgi:hypothetical protein
MRSRLSTGSWVWLILLCLVVLLQVWFPPISSGPLNDTYSVEVSGRKAFYELAAVQHPSVARNVQSLLRLPETLAPKTVVCLVGPARYPSTDEWTHLLDWVSAGGRLLVAAAAHHPEFRIDRLGVSIVGGQALRTLPQPRPGEPPPDTMSVPVQCDWLDSTALIDWRSTGEIKAPSSADVLLTVGKVPQAVRLAHGEGTVVVVASDYVFSNESLDTRTTQNALLAVRLLDALGSVNEVVFDESLNITGTPKVVGILLAPALRPLTVQLLILLVVFAWYGSRRFGGILPPDLPPRNDISEHINAVGTLNYKIRNGCGAVRSYLDQLRAELRLTTDSPTQELRILEPLAVRLQMSVPELRELLQNAEESARTPRLSRRDALAVIRNLARLRQAANVRRQS